MKVKEILKLNEEGFTVPESVNYYAVTSTPVLNEFGDVVGYETEFNNGSIEQYERVGIKPVPKSTDPTKVDEFAAYVADMTSCEDKRISSPISENFTDAAISAQRAAAEEALINNDH